MVTGRTSKWENGPVTSETAKPHVLVVDDEQGVLRLLELELSAQGFRVTKAVSAEEAEERVEYDLPDVALLDVRLPGASGIVLMHRLRQRAPKMPVILVTAEDAEKDKVAGLDLGADDYIVKPFSLDELAARVRAVIRKRGGDKNHALVRAGEIEVDLDRRLVLRKGDIVGLSASEWRLLEYLASHPNKALFSHDILGTVWGPEYSEDTQFLRVWISRVRAKIETDPANPAIITTLPGTGYRFHAAG